MPLLRLGLWVLLAPVQCSQGHPSWHYISTEVIAADRNTTGPTYRLGYEERDPLFSQANPSAVSRISSKLYASHRGMIRDLLMSSMSMYTEYINVTECAIYVIHLGNLVDSTYQGLDIGFYVSCILVYNQRDPVELTVYHRRTTCIMNRYPVLTDAFSNCSFLHTQHIIGNNWMMGSSVTVASSSSVTATHAARATVASCPEVPVTQADAVQTAPMPPSRRSVDQSKIYVIFRSTAEGCPWNAPQTFICKMEPRVLKRAIATTEIALTTPCIAKKSLSSALKDIPHGATSPPRW
ncbi:hypothetical protein HPG69_006836 [Diceros bicornis minor]|uniref:Uncharacterized protein n=1 Tax=Diceros bicornis minor TaxID=77932 RepID=A0A7J7EKW1_DICBM|nr:hypothetical protein HPG69_006836 [Diceros bicornis minor]